MANNSEIVLSPALSRIIRRDNDRDYSLRDVDGFFRTYINKEDVIAKIRERFTLLAKSNYEKFPEETLQSVARMKELVKDLEACSHADFHVLRQLQVYDVFKRPITEINKQTIILTKEA
jgi:hypothetical protein